MTFRLFIYLVIHSIIIVLVLNKIRICYNAIQAHIDDE